MERLLLDVDLYTTLSGVVCLPAACLQQLSVFQGSYLDPRHGITQLLGDTDQNIRIHVVGRRFYDRLGSGSRILTHEYS